jgi:hypothetical protein
MATPPTFPISRASFYSNTYTFDPLLADDTISQSANIAGALGVLLRGTVLCGPAPGVPVTNSTILTTVVTGAQARFILAQDIDTTGGQVVGLVYSQGKFIDTAMTFTSQGAALDVAQLRQYGIYVLTVLQRSGILVPAMKLPATGGPLPQSLSGKELAAASREEVEALKAAIAAFQPPLMEPETPHGGTPAWAIAAFGETKPTPEDAARQKTSEEATALHEKQRAALAELAAEQAKDLSELQQAQAKERQDFVKQHTTADVPSKPATPPHKEPNSPPHKS